MSRYMIVQVMHGLGYRINVDGARHTILGFDTENNAKAWVKAGQRREWRQVAVPILDAAD
jgi:antibiotic biosynthesis monooxygenase (ABM) superfamily enzyme